MSIFVSFKLTVYIYLIHFISSITLSLLLLLLLPPYNFVAPNPCNTNNGECGDTCKNNNGIAECSCTTGSLKVDGKSCERGNLCNMYVYLGTFRRINYWLEE